MAWIKSTSTHVADIRAFSLTGRSMRQLAGYGLALGVLYGVAVVKLHGLPGDDERAVRARWNSGARQAAELHDEVCRKHPESGVCKQQPPRKGGGIEQMK
jgi:hypothetical protein